MARREFDAIKVKDQLGKPDNIGIFGPFKKTENLLLEEGPCVVQFNDTTGMAIWDSPSTTWDGDDSDDEWDSYNTAGQAIVRVTNFNNTFIERFCFTTLQGDNNTATWDTTNKECTFTAGQVLEIVSAFKDSSSNQTVSSATLSVTSTSGVFDYEMSANGGANWESVILGTEHIFTHSGSDLRIRVTEDDSSTGTITVVRCQYNV
jgi:hypothetical protein